MQANPASTAPHMVTIPQADSIATINHFNNQIDSDQNVSKAGSEVRVTEQKSKHTDLVETLWTDAAPDAETQVSSLKYEDLWVLVRRFNKTVYHLKLADHIEGGMDGNIAGFETYSPEKLRGTVERFYIIVIVSLVAARKHVSRVRSWRETRRTLSFCTVYFTAWLLDLLAPAVIGFIILFAVSPTFRQKAFPHVPLAIVSVDGGLQQSAVGGIGSESTITGASEKIKGEALEAEAACVVGGITNIILNCLAIPNSTAAARALTKVNIKASGDDIQQAHTEVHEPMEAMLWDHMHTGMDTISDICDIWERVGNLMHPTLPFSVKSQESSFIVLLAAIFVSTLVTSPYVFCKAVELGIGALLFGQPIWKFFLRFTDHTAAYWRQVTRLRSTLLKGVPTNTQLTLTLLRLGEARNSPLAPPPHTDDERVANPGTLPLDEFLEKQDSDFSLQPTENELDNIDPIEIDDSNADDGEDLTRGTDVSNDHKVARKLAKIMRSSAKVGAKAFLAVDKAAAKLGSSSAKERSSHTPIENKKVIEAKGPWVFAAKHDGESGYLRVQKHSTTDTAFLSFSKSPPSILKNAASASEAEDLTAKDDLVRIDISKIAELRRVSGYGWKSKITFSYLLDQKIMDAILVVDDHGTEWLFTAMPLRNEVFNRLASIGPQKWAIW